MPSGAVASARARELLPRPPAARRRGVSGRARTVLGIAVLASVPLVVFGGWYALCAGLLTAVLVAGCRRLLAGSLGRGRSSIADRLDLATGWDLLATSLRAGLAVPEAIGTAAEVVRGPASKALRDTAELLALGADPRAAWQPALSCPDTAELATAARRAASSGTALAGTAVELAGRVRGELADRAEADAQRAGVLITAPLGLCFLPAFLCLGVAPVIAGLAGEFMGV
ncbi:type II secretion system F family protein [Haloechinothrix sp. LS1_15]|nr:type II secretion system F family protein [Haloechinothrix sp. LS1_15]